MKTYFYQAAFYLGLALVILGIALVFNDTYDWVSIPISSPFAVGMGLSFAGMLLYGWGRYHWKGDTLE
ncbi:MAG: hypothetical protein D6722_18580 [Bacteroidetes bacterium]|nr:MAG: hypothetical protein D6722_18580 [Bacteroidota bacterium]